MNENQMITCEVIKDLMPSYVDGICSQDSRKLVAGHAESCGQCRKMLELLEKTTITSDKTETEQLNYMQRVKQSYHNKSLTGFRLLTIVVSAIMFYVLLNVLAFSGLSNTAKTARYITQALMIAAAYGLMQKDIKTNLSKKLSHIFIASSAALMLYLAFLAWRMVCWVETGRYPFGMEMSRIGPFLDRLLIVGFLIAFGIFVCCIMLPVWDIHVKNAAATAAIACCHMAVVFDSLLKSMATPDMDLFITLLLTQCGVLLAQAAAAAVILACTDRYAVHKKNSI